MAISLISTVCFLLLVHLFFQKKDAFFVLRSAGIFLSFSVLVYYATQLLGFKNNILYYPAIFLAISALIILVKYRTKKNLEFLFLNRSDFDWKSIFILIGAFSLVAIACLSYYCWQIVTPQYLSADAPFHFRNARLAMEINGPVVDPVYAAFFTTSTIFLFKSLSVESVLRYFQIYNIAVFSLLSIYFFFLINRSFPIKSKPILILAFFATVFGFFYNLFVMGFFPQMMGLLFLLLFFDLYAMLEKKWHGILLLFSVALAVFVSYVYWFPLIIIFLFLDYLNKTMHSKKVWHVTRNALFFGAIFLLIVLAKYKALSKVALVEGETYKVILSNFVLLSPFFLYGIYLSLKSTLHDSYKGTLIFFSSLIFSTLLGISYALEKTSSYTFLKSIYLTGPLIFYASLYALDILLGKLRSSTVRRILAFSFAIFSFAFLLSPLYTGKSDSQNLYDMQKLETQLNSSFDKASIWDIHKKPFDIFFFNLEISLHRNSPLLESLNFVNKDEIGFLRGLPKHLPDGISELNIVANRKNSYWFLVLTGIWNSSANDPESFDDKGVDYDDWLKNHKQPYLIILDSQTARKWLWLNQGKFKWEDFDIIFQNGQNYLLKLKETN
jgi:hypothetical protein